MQSIRTENKIFFFPCVVKNRINLAQIFLLIFTFYFFIMLYLIVLGFNTFTILLFFRCTDSLRSLILALKATKANICYFKESSICEELANGIKDEINQEGSRDTTLVILDRRVDPITPLLNQWTYQVKYLLAKLYKNRSQG